MSKRYNVSGIRPEQISLKAAWLLKGVLAFLLIILIRIWYLAVYEHDTLIEEAKKPMQRSMFEGAKRGTIRDRFNLPLAINKINYQAAVVFSAISALPQVVFEKDLAGNKIKRYYRREYIEKLSHLLGKVLNESSEKIEDLIWSTASFYGETPFVIKDGISEQQYFKLLNLARLWPGISPQLNAKRYYPGKKTGSDILGYMGAINQGEYNKVFEEIHHLQSILADYQMGEAVDFPIGLDSIEKIESRLTLLQEKAYNVTDFVGKSGVEKKFEEKLRGSFGKKSFEADSKGNFLKELPGSKKPQSGERLLLTISKELQEYAEQLLAFQELLRDERPLHAKQNQESVPALKAPWIKGGAIVAMDPRNGEILALATYPRFDPNDYIPGYRGSNEGDRTLRIHQWLESEVYIKNLWLENTPLEREFFNLLEGEWRVEKQYLSWRTYLEWTYQKESLGFQTIKDIKNIKMAYQVLKDPSTLPSSLDAYQKNLIVDLLGLLIDLNRFPSHLLDKIGHISLDDFKQASSLFERLKTEAKKISAAYFHETKFIPWRKSEGKAFLKQKRVEEKENKEWSKPYITYFNREERRQFEEFWSLYGSLIIHTFAASQLPEMADREAAPFLYHILDQKGVSDKSLLTEQLANLNFEEGLSYLHALRAFEDLNRPLLGHYKRLRYPNEQGLAMAFYPRYGFGYGRSFAFRQAALQGSIFKIVTAFAGLNQRYQDLSLTKDNITRADLNYLEVTDRVQQIQSKWYVGYWPDGSLIPQIYKGGRIPRSMNYNIGKVDVVRAIETSSNLFFSLVVANLPSEEPLLNAMRAFSYGQKTGIDLTGEIAGSLPKDLHENPTGLYATSIGQHSLVVTPLQTAVMLSAIANGGKVFKPKIALLSLEKEQGDTLVHDFPTEIKNDIFIPKPIKDLILTGLKKVTLHTRPQDIKRYYAPYQKSLDGYAKVHKDLTTKTSTSEAIENLGLGTGPDPFQLCHTWCGTIAFEESSDENADVFLTKDLFGKPELAIVVYLRCGRLGKETYPLAALLAQKWRDIKASHAQ